MQTLSKKKAAELRRLDRKIMSGRNVTRKEILRAFDLQHESRWLAQQEG